MHPETQSLWLPPIPASTRIFQLVVYALAVTIAFGTTSHSKVEPISQPATPDICVSAANTAARESGVPLSVMLAISLTETGRKKNGQFSAWPWTVNMEGKGVWFDNQSEALAFANTNFARGARSFDVGCFQINYKWHHTAFSSIEEMFDPLQNARYAARYLTELFEEKQDWNGAAGAYHSRTKKYAERYTKRFSRIRANLISDGLDVVAPLIVAIEKKPNLYPLLQTSAASTSSIGSLVRLDNSGPVASLLTATSTPLF